MIQIKLTKLLEERERTLYWLSKHLGIRYATIWNLSKGKADSLKIDTLDKICQALDCQPGDLLIHAKRTRSKPKATAKAKRK